MLLDRVLTQPESVPASRIPSSGNEMMLDSAGSLDTIVCIVRKKFNKKNLNTNAYFGAGSSNEPIWLDDVNCLDTETNVGQCLSGGWGIHNCVHLEDAGVRCSGELCDMVEDHVCVCVCTLYACVYACVVTCVCIHHTAW